MGHELKMRILTYAQYMHDSRKNAVQPGEVKLLAVLSKQLQAELMSHTYQPLLQQYPFFRCYAEIDPDAMVKVCSTAISHLHFSPGDRLFTEFTNSDCMLFVVKGSFKYIPTSTKLKQADHFRETEEGKVMRVKRSGASFHEHGLHILSEGCWCCEVSLWTNWHHQGAMHAISFSEVVAINAAAFAKVTASCKKVAGFSFRYGQAVLKRLSNYEHDGGFASDIPWDETFWPEMIEHALQAAAGPDDDEHDDEHTGQTSKNSAKAGKNDGQPDDMPRMTQRL